jgi:hypothetical protein
MKFKIKLIEEGGFILGEYEHFIVPNIGDSLPLVEGDVFRITDRLLPVTDDIITLYGYIQ